MFKKGNVERYEKAFTLADPETPEVVIRSYLRFLLLIIKISPICETENRKIRKKKLKMRHET